MTVQSMVSKKAHTKKRRPKTRPLDAEIFELAEKVALIFDWPQAAPLRGRLFELAGAYRNRIRPHGPADSWAITTKWTAFILRMVLTCPSLLSKPSEFEWVRDDLEHILSRRNWEAKFERDFWDAMTRVKKAMWTGHPHDKAMDYFRYTTVYDLMHPPVQLIEMLVPYSKGEAVERAIEMEDKLVGTRPHERVIHRSIVKVEKELIALNALLPPEVAIGPLPTTKRASKPKKSKKRITQATETSRNGS